jgi:hypothetical protein
MIVVEPSGLQYLKLWKFKGSRGKVLRELVRCLRSYGVQRGDDHCVPEKDRTRESGVTAVHDHLDEETFGGVQVVLTRRC